MSSCLARLNRFMSRLTLVVLIIIIVAAIFLGLRTPGPKEISLNELAEQLKSGISVSVLTIYSDTGEVYIQYADRRPSTFIRRSDVENSVLEELDSLGVSENILSKLNVNYTSAAESQSSAIFPLVVNCGVALLSLIFLFVLIRALFRSFKGK